MITGKGPSKRHEIFYFTESTLSAVRIDDFKYRFTDQPGGWPGATVKVDWPILTNLRLDPFERTGMPNGVSGSLAFYNWFAYEFWRFVFVQQEVAKYAQTFIDFPPMQPAPASIWKRSSSRSTGRSNRNLRLAIKSLRRPARRAPWIEAVRRAFLPGKNDDRSVSNGI